MECTTCGNGIATHCLHTAYRNHSLCAECASTWDALPLKTSGIWRPRSVAFTNGVCQHSTTTSEHWLETEQRYETSQEYWDRQTPAARRSYEIALANARLEQETGEGADAGYGYMGTGTIGNIS